ncbi:hypothetical protein P691DRAFT_77456 [Macrolepiota fuliginosa MF-IS2]|uniref:Uncharacterized protein n=1 Tax=Macrolepiota fuliginosa MF-IS2 TaxID=1400762 RepID=A0A9P6BWQ0_9AGAR|nr:hypothetical protein P691DRAFT_77456 [Macrolepiota fuliginosa MF-IS2]
MCDDLNITIGFGYIWFPILNAVRRLYIFSVTIRGVKRRGGLEGEFSIKPMHFMRLYFMFVCLGACRGECS